MRLMGLNELISNKSFVAIKNGLRINKNDRKQENLIKNDQNNDWIRSKHF